MKRFLVHPTVVLALLGLVAVLLVVGSFLPEKPFALDPDGFDHYLSPDGLHHLFTTHAAGALVALCLLSLALACWDMFRTAWGRTFDPAVPSEWRTIEAAAAPEGTPELTLRLVREGAVAGQLSLRPGDAGPLAEATVRLVGVRRWSGLLVDGGRGMTVVFLGFCLVVLGAALLYATSPAELVAVRQSDGRMRVGLRTIARRDRGGETLDRLVARLERREGAP